MEYTILAVNLIFINTYLAGKSISNYTIFECSFRERQDYFTPSYGSLIYIF